LKKKRTKKKKKKKKKLKAMASRFDDPEDAPTGVPVAAPAAADPLPPVAPKALADGDGDAGPDPAPSNADAAREILAGIDVYRGEGVISARDVAAAADDINGGGETSAASADHHQHHHHAHSHGQQPHDSARDGGEGWGSDDSDDLGADEVALLEQVGWSAGGDFAKRLARGGGGHNSNNAGGGTGAGPGAGSSGGGSSSGGGQARPGKGRINLAPIHASLREHGRREDRDRVRHTDKSERATVEQVLDPRTRLILFKMVARGALSAIKGCISTGKEANVYYAVGPEGEDLAVKVYKTSILGAWAGVVELVFFLFFFFCISALVFVLGWGSALGAV
jgi:hypothetical protein